MTTSLSSEAFEKKTRKNETEFTSIPSEAPTQDIQQEQLGPEQGATEKNETAEEIIESVDAVDSDPESNMKEEYPNPKEDASDTVDKSAKLIFVSTESKSDASSGFYDYSQASSIDNDVDNRQSYTF